VENPMHQRTSKTLLLTGSLIAVLGVALGAFGAHGLKSMVSAERLGTFETAVRYQMYHAFGFIAAGLACRTSQKQQSRGFKAVGWLWGMGILLFCGSLYLLVFINGPWLGLITPFGGMALISGWALLAWIFVKDG
jgi:uncharacterized membrane protein YgdD (TMEM256/DUF423 family)